MLRLRSKNLSKPTRQYLASLQAEVDAQTDRKAKSDRIDALWSGKTNTRAGQAAFEEIKKALDDMHPRKGVCQYCEGNENSPVVSGFE